MRHNEHEADGENQDLHSLGEFWQMTEHKPHGSQGNGEVGNLGADKLADGLHLAFQDELLQVAFEVLQVLFSCRLVVHTGLIYGNVAHN
jgi:hypothetical protein